MEGTFNLTQPVDLPVQSKPQMDPVKTTTVTMQP